MDAHLFLLTHKLQLLSNLNLADTFPFFSLEAFLLLVLVSQRVQRLTSVLQLSQLILKILVVTTRVLLILDVLQESRVIVLQLKEQGLHGRIVRDASSSHRVRLHAVYVQLEDLFELLNKLVDFVVHIDLLRVQVGRFFVSFGAIACCHHAAIL